LQPILFGIAWNIENLFQQLAKVSSEWWPPEDEKEVISRDLAAIIALYKRDSSIIDPNDGMLAGITYAQKADIIEFLLNKGFHPDSPSASEMTQTPLIICALTDNSDLAKILINSGADLNKPMKQGLTPLMIATVKNNYAFASLLIEFGASVNARIVIGVTALSLASENEFPDLVRLLLNSGANPNQRPLPNRGVPDERQGASASVQSAYEQRDRAAAAAEPDRAR
jgi:ankyrin repeat protein